MNIQEILKHLPHRYPFLLIDRILEIELGKRIKGLKNITFNEPCFMGHFPEHPVMPGVLILEALAQTAGILAYKTAELPDDHTSLLYLAGFDKARFKRIVSPGDQLILDVEIVRVKQDIWKFDAKATVEGELACSASLLAARKDVKK